MSIKVFDIALKTPVTLKLLNTGIESTALDGSKYPYNWRQVKYVRVDGGNDLLKLHIRAFNEHLTDIYAIQLSSLAEVRKWAIEANQMIERLT